MTDVILPSWGSRVGRQILTKHEQLPNHRAGPPGGTAGTGRGSPATSPQGDEMRHTFLPPPQWGHALLRASAYTSHSASRVC